MAQGIVHLLDADGVGGYRVRCGTILDRVDAGVTRSDMVTCGWCQRDTRPVSPEHIKGVHAAVVSEMGADSAAWMMRR